MPSLKTLDQEMQNVQAKIDIQEREKEQEQNEADRAHAQGEPDRAKRHEDLVNYNDQKIQGYQNLLESLQGDRDQLEAEIQSLQSDYDDMLRSQAIQREELETKIKLLQG